MQKYWGRRALAVVAVVVALAIAAPRFLTNTPFPRLGIVPTWATPNGFARVAEVSAPPGRGILKRGDLLLEIDGRPFTPKELERRYKENDWPAGPLPLVIERDGLRQVVTLPPVKLSAWQRVRLYMVPLAAVVAAPLVAFLLVWRRPDLSSAWVFLWFAALQGMEVVWEMFRYPQTEAGPVMRVYMALYRGLVMWFPAAFLHFMTVFPRPRWPRGSPWRSVWVWILTLAYMAPVAILVFGPKLPGGIDQGYLWFQRVALPLGALSLIDRYARRAREDWNPRMRERVLALGVAFVLLGASALELIFEGPGMLIVMSLPLVRLVVTVLGIAWLFSPLVIAYLIANDPVFDPRRIVAQGLPYALLSGVLASIYLVLVLLSQRLFAAAAGEDAVAFNVAAALIVAFAFAPLRDRLQRWIDRLYGRDPEAQRRALDAAGRDLLGAVDHATLRFTVERGLAKALRSRVAVEWPESGGPRLAAPEEVPESARGGVENLLLQARIRLESLILQEQRAADQRRAVELREAATRAELRALQAQVQPHFLFNALNALSYLTECDPPAAQRFTERLADMLRYTIEAGARPAALLSEELGFVEDYLGVARERYETPLDFQFRGARELLSLAVPPLMLQPLVENSLKHGCSPEAPALHLTLEAQREDGWVTLRFADDGVVSGNGAPGLGVGLANLEQRLRRFAGDGAMMAAGPHNGGGFAVTLRWPVLAEAR